MFKLSFEANNLLITQQDSDPGLSDSKACAFMYYKVWLMYLEAHQITYSVGSYMQSHWAAMLFYWCSAEAGFSFELAFISTDTSEVHRE